MTPMVLTILQIEHQLMFSSWFKFHGMMCLTLDVILTHVGRCWSMKQHGVTLVSLTRPLTLQHWRYVLHASDATHPVLQKGVVWSMRQELLSQKFSATDYSIIRITRTHFVKSLLCISSISCLIRSTAIAMETVSLVKLSLDTVTICRLWRSRGPISTRMGTPWQLVKIILIR